jgi:hypothetical protein
LHVPDGFVLPDQVTEVQGTVWKVAASLGGHNAVVALRR